MNTELFQVFIDVYRLQSFAAVAKRRNIAPSSVTRSIAQLEEELGFRLFQRTTRKVAPTEEGEDFYNRILPINEELGKIKDKTTSSRLRITANVAFSYLYLNRIIGKFKKRHPEINLEILISDEYIDLVAERVDIAIRFGKVPDSTFIGSKLFDLEYVLCASPAFIKGKIIQRPHDIQQYDCLGFLISRYNLTWTFKKKGKTTEIQLNPHIKVRGAIPLIEYAKMGLGLTVVPKKMIEKELKSGKLIELLEDYKVTATDFGSAAWVLYPSKEFVPTKVKLFNEFLKRELDT